MRRVSCQVGVWTVHGCRGFMNAGRLEIRSRVCRTGIAGREAIIPDTQALRAQWEKPRVTAPDDPPFNPGRRKNYVSKNSAHSFGGYRGKRDEWYRGGAPHIRV